MKKIEAESGHAVEVPECNYNLYTIFPIGDRAFAFCKINNNFLIPENKVQPVVIKKGSITPSYLRKFEKYFNDLSFRIKGLYYAKVDLGEYVAYVI